MKPFHALRFIEKTYLVLLLIIFGGIVLHAPFIVGMETLFPDHELLIKSWKEILMVVATFLALALIAQKNLWRLFNQPIVIIAISYGVLHILMLPLLWNGLLPSIAGLMIDLRFVLFFLLVYLAVQLYPAFRKTFLYVGVIGAAIFVSFAVLQVFVLPPDVLSYIGYDRSTIVPYLTVDQNPDYVRINSTLRGPNSVGQYALIILSSLGAYLLAKRPINWTKLKVGIIVLLSVGALVALWFSYSRSALVAALVAVGLIVALTVGRKLPRWAWVSGLVVVVALIGGLIAARDSSFVSNIILHENPNGGSAISSNDGHVESLQNGAARLLSQPFGAGVGSTGSASLIGDDPLVLENIYLFIAHEVGWLGLALFLVMFIYILVLLWRRRRDWLALAILSSGIGLALVGVLLPVWVDDTIAIIWWGLAAVAIGGKQDGRKIDQKTA